MWLKWVKIACVLSPLNPAYGELLDVMPHTTTRLDLAWGVGDRKRLMVDLMSISCRAIIVLPPWASPFFPISHGSGEIMEGFSERGCVRMSPVEEALVSYLSQGKSSSLKAPVLSSKPLQTTLCLNGVYGSRSGLWGLKHYGCVAGLPGRSNNNNNFI